MGKYQKKKSKMRGESAISAVSRTPIIPVNWSAKRMKEYRTKTHSSLVITPANGSVSLVRAKRGW